MSATIRRENGDNARLRALFDSAGAQWIEVPVLHPADPFLETAGEDIRRKMFVTEGPTGERLALRPDFTIPVCLAHLKSGAGAARYAYQGLVFRRHDSDAPERLETGYEDIGRADVADADAEALSLAIAAVSTVVAGPLTIRLGDIGLFNALLRALGLPGRWRRRLRRSFGVPELMAKNLENLSPPRDEGSARLDPDIRAAAEDRDALVTLLGERALAQGQAPGVGRSPAEIAERFLDQRAVPDARLAATAMRKLQEFLRIEAKLADAPEAVAAFAAKCGADLGEPLAFFAERAREIAKRAPSVPIRFEAGFGRPLDYYSGLVFEIGAPGFAGAIAGGGRYDRLMEMLGANHPIPAVGFTMRLDLGAPARVQ